MLVMTATAGARRRNEPSLSSASATRNGPCPRRALVPSAWRRPPTTMVGSRPPRASTAATIEVVVVLAGAAPPAPAVLTRHQRGQQGGAGDPGPPPRGRGMHPGVVGGARRQIPPPLPPSPVGRGVPENHAPAEPDDAARPLPRF